MTAMLSLALLLTAGATHAPAELPDAAVKQLARGVHRARCFSGWRTDFAADALQEACVLALEAHPELTALTDEQVRNSWVEVGLADGRVVDKPMEARLYELGIKARNTVLRDNHLNRQTRGETATFGPLGNTAEPSMRWFGRRVPPIKPTE